MPPAPQIKTLYQQLSEDIVRGIRATGTHLPESAELARLYSCDIATVQLILDQLEADRFIIRPTSDVSIVTGPVMLTADAQDAIPDARRDFAQALHKLLDWASNEAFEALFDDVVAKHLAAASERLIQRYKLEKPNKGG